MSDLNTSNPHRITFTYQKVEYAVLGGLSKQWDSMRITLQVQNALNKKSRNKLDLYEDRQIERVIKEISEKLQLEKSVLESGIYQLTDLLEKWRNEQFESQNQVIEPEIKTLTTVERKKLESFAKRKNLISTINELLGQTGIVGEEHNRIFLFLIALSHKLNSPLHALIQGSSGSGKTRLLKQISDCMPEESLTKLTRLSDKVLYNYPEDYFTNRLLCLEDIDGLSEEAEFAFRELQSNGELNSAISIKLENGNIVQGEKKVKGPIASLACTTHGEIYEDNMSRCFLVAVDESQAQTERVISYQNRRAAGGIQIEEEESAKSFLQSFSRFLGPHKVVNPFAGQITLPKEAHKIRRLNELFQGFIKVVTITNQYNRKFSDNKKLITELEDIEIAIDILFESIVLKVDELDGSLRQFFEQLKTYVLERSQILQEDWREIKFNRFEIRKATGISKTRQHHFIHQLVQLEYLAQFGHANKGYFYSIRHWDDYTALREKIKLDLQSQLKEIKSLRTK